MIVTTLAEAGMLDRILDLSRVSWSDDKALLGWRYPLPAWGWALVVLAALAVAAFSYARLTGPRWMKVPLGLTRALLVVLIAALLAGPMLVLPREHVEPDTLIMLVDRSQSMQVQDTLDPANSAAAVSRDQALRAALAREQPLFGDEALGRERRILWLGFDSQTFDLPGQDPALWPAPTGQATALRTAIEQAVRQVAGQPISGIVLMSDGRSPQLPAGTPADLDPASSPDDAAAGTSRSALVTMLSRQAVGVYVVPLGAAQSPLDIAVAQVEVPDKAFVSDTVPVTVWLERYPPGHPLDPANVTVRLVDAQTGEVLDERHPSDPDLATPVRLLAESKTVGVVNWRVEVVYQPPANLREELVVDNNQREVTLELIDRPIRVLYVEGYPRWEYRYLKNVLIREKSVEVSIMLASADRSFAQEGNLPIIRLPRTDEEFKPYDVIVIGDVNVNYFSREQFKLIREQVSQQGAGLLWIGGERYMPRAYESTDLAALLPMRRPALVHRADLSAGPLTVRPNALAKSLSVLQLFDPALPPTVTADGGYWPDNLPGLYWMQQVGPLKSTAEPLAQAATSAGEIGPLVTRLRYGAGQAVYVATDDTWRWRRGRGDLYFEQFWMQMVRMLGRSRVQQDTSRVRLSVSGRRVEIDQPIVLTVRVEDPLLLKRDLPRIALSVTRADEPDEPGRQLELFPQPVMTDDDEVEPDTAAREYRAIWRPTEAGRMLVRVTEAALADHELVQEVRVVRPDDELRQPTPDHPNPPLLPLETGGRVVPLAQLDQLAQLIPNRARRTPDDITETLWDSYLTLIIVLGLLTIEWVGRKLIRLA